jgi:hypothetical protein
MPMWPLNGSVGQSLVAPAVSGFIWASKTKIRATHTDGSDVFPAGTESSVELDGTMKSYRIDVNVGDLVDVGRFRNVQAKIKGIEIDEHGQPVIITQRARRNCSV